jgi:hypothetical protein
MPLMYPYGPISLSQARQLLFEELDDILVWDDDYSATAHSTSERRLYTFDDDDGPRTFSFGTNYTSGANKYHTLFLAIFSEGPRRLETTLWTRDSFERYCAHRKHTPSSKIVRQVLLSLKARYWHVDDYATLKPFGIEQDPRDTRDALWLACQAHEYNGFSVYHVGQGVFDVYVNTGNTPPVEGDARVHPTLKSPFLRYEGQSLGNRATFTLRDAYACGSTLPPLIQKRNEEHQTALTALQEVLQRSF